MRLSSCLAKLMFFCRHEFRNELDGNHKVVAVFIRHLLANE